jgi:integrase
VYHEYAAKSESAQYLRNKRTFLGLIEHFEVYGQYPDRRRRQKIVRYDKYHILTDEFKAVIDYYRAAEKKSGKKDSTIYVEAHNASTLLYALQEKGIEKAQDITEEAVLSVFVGTNGNLQRSCSYKKNIAAVFKACVPQDPEIWNRVLVFLPMLREGRKNIQYLLPEEIIALKQTLSDETTDTSLRDKAIGMVILHTGLRGCDVAGMMLDSFDWENDLIFISQQKTDMPLELPLTAVVGNAVWDYLTARPKTESKYLFVSENKPHTRLKNRSIWNISRKIMDAANVRQDDDDRGGFHIFRHRLATALLGNGVARPVISQILGHESPDSSEVYLSADFAHLRECTLSVESFPVSEGVFGNA